MLTLTQAAQVCRYVGQRGGRPAYAPVGTPLRCRVHPMDAREAGARGFDAGGSAMVFAECADVRPGDRLVLEDGGALIVSRVSAMRGLDRVHHLEIEARPEG